MARTIGKVCQGVLRCVKVFLRVGKHIMAWLGALKQVSRVQRKLAN